MKLFGILFATEQGNTEPIVGHLADSLHGRGFAGEVQNVSCAGSVKNRLPELPDMPVSFYPCRPALGRHGIAGSDFPGSMR